VGYMTVIQQDGEDKRIIIVDPTNDKYVAKDRTGQLGKYIPPNFSETVNACQGTATYVWSAKEAKTAPAEATDAPETKVEAETTETTSGVKKDAVAKKTARKIRTPLQESGIAEEAPEVDSTKLKAALKK